MNKPYPPFLINHLASGLHVVFLSPLEHAGMSESD